MMKGGGDRRQSRGARLGADTVGEEEGKVEGEIVGLKVGIDDVGGKDGDVDGSTVGKT